MESEIMSTIAVLGGTGTVGRPLIEALLRRGKHPVLLLSRNPEKMPVHWREAGVEHRPFDIDAPRAEAFEKIQRLFVLVNPRAVGPHRELELTKLALSASLDRVVRISVVGADSAAVSAPRQWHGSAEDAWRRTSIPLLSLRANYFVQSLLKFGPGIAKKGSFSAPTQTGRVSFTDVQDLAQAAAQALIMPKPMQGLVNITGPQAYTFAEAAEEMARCWGRPVSFLTLSREEFISRLMRTPGMPPQQAEMLTNIYDDIESGLNETISPVDRLFSDIEPSSFGALLRQSAPYGQGRPE
jgi:uncharacterized protein YbjT (DUF2867 family)